MGSQFHLLCPRCACDLEIGVKCGRALCFALALSSSPLAAAQVFGSYELLRAGYPLINRDPNRAPVNLPGGSSTEPAAPARTDDRELEIIRAGSLNRDDKKIQISGGTEVLYRGYRCFADQIDGDLDTEVFDLSGNVKIIGADAVVYGDKVRFNFKNESYVSERGGGMLRPSLLKGAVTDNVYISSVAADGTERENHFKEGDFTTCSLGDHSHYEIESADTVVRTSKRVIFRKARIRFFGKTIITIPFLSIPIEDQQSRYTPDVGQSRDEGYYVKSRFGLSASDRMATDLRVDYMSKFGPALGTDYAYANGKMDGLTQIYTVLGAVGTLTMKNQHRQQLGSGEISIQNDYQRNNYLTSPGSTLFNTNAQYNLRSRTTNTNLNFQRNRSEFGESVSETEVISISDDRNIGALQTSSNLSYSVNRNAYGDSNSFESKQLDVRLRANQNLPFANAVLEYQRLVPVGDSVGSFGTADRTPVLTLTSDASKILGKRQGLALPFRTSLSIGEFGGLQGSRVTRSIFDWALNKSSGGRSRFSFDYSSVFKQSMYSDDTAQYVVGAGWNAAYRLGGDTSANLRYNYLRPEGYTPLAQDRTGRTHTSTFDVSTRPLRTFLVGAQTGFDFNQSKQSDIGWQQFNLRTEYRPRDYLNFRTLTTYDTISQNWSSVRLDFTYQPGATFVTLGARYDGFQKRWSNANLYLANLKWGRTRVGAVLSYNGFTKEIDAAQYNAVYDLHCWELVLSLSEYKTGFRPGREVQVFFRLKAFPTDLPFGIGRRGQSIGSNIGFNN